MGRLTSLPFWPPRNFLVGKVSLTSRMRNKWSLSCIWVGLRLSFHLSFCYPSIIEFLSIAGELHLLSLGPKYLLPHHHHVCVCVCAHTQSCMTPCNPWTVPCQARLLCLWDLLGKNTRVGWHFLTEGLNLCLWCLLMLAGGYFTPVPPGKPVTISLMNFPEYFYFPENNNTNIMCWALMCSTVWSFCLYNFFLIMLTLLWTCCHHSHLRDEETEAWEDWVMCPRQHGQ